MIEGKADVVIVGGGVIGCSVAYHLLKMDPELDIVVFEKSRTREGGSTALSASAIRQQWIHPLNIALMKYSLRFYERIKNKIDLRQNGYLFLVERGHVRERKKVWKKQRRHGVNSIWVERKWIEEKFPYLNLPDKVVAGTFGPKDGFMPARKVLNWFRHQLGELGRRKKNVRFHYEKVVTVNTHKGIVRGVESLNRRILAPVVINAAGPWGKEVAEMADTNLPMIPIRREVFLVERLPGKKMREDYKVANKDRKIPWNLFRRKKIWIRSVRGILDFFREGKISAEEKFLRDFKDMPMIVSPSGMYIRPFGDEVLTGELDPNAPKGINLEFDDEFFIRRVRPKFMEYMPLIVKLRELFNSGKPFTHRGWAGMYAESHDHSALLGESEVKGFYFANALSGHGLMQAPGIGKIVAWLVLRGDYPRITRNGKFVRRGKQVLNTRAFDYKNPPEKRPLEGAQL